MSKVRVLVGTRKGAFVLAMPFAAIPVVVIPFQEWIAD